MAKTNEIASGAFAATEAMGKANHLDVGQIKTMDDNRRYVVFK